MRKEKIRNFLILIMVLCIMYMEIHYLLKDKSYAGTAASSESDVQLIARAINRRSKRRKL